VATLVEVMDAFRLEHRAANSKKKGSRDKPIRFDRPEIKADEDPTPISPGDFIRQMTKGA